MFDELSPSRISFENSKVRLTVCPGFAKGCENVVLFGWAGPVVKPYRETLMEVINSKLKLGTLV